MPEASESTRDIRVRKVPALIQRQIDLLIEKSKNGSLTPEEQASLTEVLDYLDDLTLLELERIARNRSA